MRPPVHVAQRARSIFEELGYTVEGNGVRGQFRAERAWKVVNVTAVEGERPEDPGGSDELHCFVTDGDPDALHRELERMQPEFEYAIISVEDEDDYEVVRAPPVGR